MVNRVYWQSLIEKNWTERSVVWLHGVRRAGKTFLCQSLPDTEYFDCELPRVRRMMEDPEAFLSDLKDRRVVLDEVHRLQNPSELLKIAADHFSSCRVLATGSSTLAASSKFRDTLTGRKRNVWLTPMTLGDLVDFGATNLKHRLLHGGLPRFFLSPHVPEKDFQEWMDDYWSKDVQELFRLERRSSFQRFVELVLAQSGGMFEASSFAAPCEVSRTTISNYLKVLEATMVAHVVRPFSTQRPTEIVTAPRVYGFDTGFVCYYRGWQSLRDDDLGLLWEHFVLNEVQARMQDRSLRYWRDKRGHEVDFVLLGERQAPVAIECKWRADRFDPSGMQSFRRQHVQGRNFVVAQDVDRPHSRTYGDLAVRYVGLPDLIEQL
jgi:predicted AAA+ superfamily ATPase